MRCGKIMDVDKEKSRITEDLATLYLRLNGYLTSGFILHSSEEGKIHTELDGIGVRFRYNREPERGVAPDAFLNPSNRYNDIVLCEVKRGKKLQFNKPLLKGSDRLARVLRWIGLFNEAEVQRLAPLVLDALQAKEIASPDIPEVICGENFRIRGLLIAPERDVKSRSRTEPFYVGGDILFSYIWKCMRPPESRPKCGTKYDYSGWGHLERTVRYFKELDAEGPGTIADLYGELLKPKHDEGAGPPATALG